MCPTLFSIDRRSMPASDRIASPSIVSVIVSTTEPFTDVVVVVVVGYPFSCCCCCGRRCCARDRNVMMASARTRVRS